MACQYQKGMVIVSKGSEHFHQYVGHTCSHASNTSPRWQVEVPVSASDSEGRRALLREQIQRHAVGFSAA